MMYYGYSDIVKFETLLGEKFSKIHKSVDDKELIFTTWAGRQYIMKHDQDCCEEVYIEDIAGDLKDLLYEPIILAEEVTNRDGEPLEKWNDSFTWTFYKLAIKNGHVTIRWYGASNGYYSEDVGVYLVPEASE